MSVVVQLPWNTLFTLLQHHTCQVCGHLCSAAPQCRAKVMLLRLLRSLCTQELLVGAAEHVF